ncbi:alpha/beta-hydrolase [Cryphonectria parasitica EP155]|uniref:Alpha/beta-hydrolase n=1 Tax=Cryphonectria parasitica (strain ATCC 38755 / EP155) TaxID=660469 RepID=A0A9P5CWT8_CRYP1|nr:alpha/beta-hydrolase [Cryphonectria parasitica EP155]KAF3771275.1 alpha/beta-hydrolase [Cryphonectria parasitica EP155]
MSSTPSAARLALGVLGAALVAPTRAQLWNKTIQTTYGPVSGYKYFDESVLEDFFGTTESTVTAFLGIPFAADTSYQNRWKPPQPREVWNETLVADTWGAPCPSKGTAGYSEDCLNLNIWTSANSSDDKLPVIVWNQGSDETSNDAWWYGGGMAQQHDVIVVTFNRRDDAFGYLAHPELNAESLAENGHNSSGNYGVLDHLECLKWVQKNIANFGGDPDRVTIQGQSFGSSQVYHAVNSILFKGLFHAAISESGIHTPYNPWVAGLATSYVNMSMAIEHGLNYTTYHNATSIAELRELSVDDLLDGSQDRIPTDELWWVTAIWCGYPLIFKPVLDGYVLPEKYIEQALAGPANDVPLITGGTKDENGASPTNDFTPDEVTLWNTLRMGNLSTDYFRYYAVGNTSTNASETFNAGTTDAGTVSQWLYAQDWVLKSNATSPIYTYAWDHAPPGQDSGAFHQSEIMYTLNALYANNDTYPFTEYDYYVQSMMSAYWANFAKTGNPNDGGSYSNGSYELPYWAPNDGVTRQIMRLGDGFANRTLTQVDEQVDLWIDYYAQQVPF